MHFVVLSYPRTGSTVIQRLINIDKEAICVGEKPMAINHLYAFYKSIEDSRFEIPLLFPSTPLDDDRNPVFNVDKTDLSLVRHMLGEVFQDAVLAPGKKTKVGWKENFISSYADGGMADEQVLFIRSLFPGIKFILNIRDPENTAQSAIWKIRDDAINEISQRRQWIIDRYNSGLFGTQSVLLDYDQWSTQPTKIVEGLTSIGIDINNAEAYTVLSERLTHLQTI
jgi:hypothetical protein